MRLGIGEFKLGKKGLLLEMHFQTNVILLRTPSTLVPSATKKRAVRKCHFKTSTSKMNMIRQPI